MLGAHVRGLLLPGIASVSLTAYGDDISLFVWDRDSIDSVVAVCSCYACLFGASLNSTNMKGLRVGDFRGVLLLGIPLCSKDHGPWGRVCLNWCLLQTH